jgi:hypothetical protein
MLVCGLIIFELAVVIALLVIAGIYAKDKVELWDERAVILFAWLDRFDRNQQELKTDLDGKFGPDLIKKLNDIFKIGANPKNIVFDQNDKKFHRVTPGY